MYIIDTNFLININREIPVDIQDDLWNLILHLARTNYLKIPEKVIDELEKGSDGLAPWVKTYKKDLIIKTDDVFDVLEYVLSKYQEGHAAIPLDELDMLESIADPYVIAHAIKLGAIVVSSERPCKGNYLTQKPKNRQIPDICCACSIPCMTGMKFLVQIAKLLK